MLKAQRDKLMKTFHSTVRDQGLQTISKSDEELAKEHDYY
jgi:hypothetical protein